MIGGHRRRDGLQHHGLAQAFGGDTISPRCPLPTGATRSMIRPVAGFPGLVPFSRRSRSCGYSGVSLANSGRCAARPGAIPLIVETLASSGYFSRLARLSRLPGAWPARGGRAVPSTASPWRSPYCWT